MNDTTKSLFSLHLFGFRFTPKLLPTVLTLIIVPLFCSMGVWQYHRAAFKKELLAEYASRQGEKPLLLKVAKKIEFYPVVAEGKFDTEHQILVENKYYQHHIGYEVFTPLRLKDNSIVLVNRGWIPRNKNKHISQPPKNTTIKGIIHTLPDKIFQIGQIPEQSTWPKLVQNASWRSIKRVLPNEKLQPFVIVLQKGSPYSFTPIYTPSIMPPAKHLGYAFQWFAMALTILLIFIGVNTKKQVK